MKTLKVAMIVVGLFLLYSVLVGPEVAEYYHALKQEAHQ
jgi:hypothetical protein